MVARGRRRWRASGCGRWKGYKLFESVEIGLLVMCVRGIEPRTREGDENGEEQRAWFGGKRWREDDDELHPSSIYLKFSP